jgi:coenzyme PQQ synthesis protein D (PqqD)
LVDDGLKFADQRRFQLNEPAVVADVIDRETIIMNLESGDYYSLNDSGGELWALLLAGLHREELLATIAERYGTKPSTGEIDAFIGRLLEHRLILPTEQRNGADGVADRAQPMAGPWSTPEISVYADMKDLLAMDPPLPLLRPNRG